MMWTNCVSSTHPPRSLKLSASTRIVDDSAAIARLERRTAVKSASLIRFFMIVSASDSLSPVLRGEGWGEGSFSRAARFPESPLTLTLTPEYGGEGMEEAAGFRAYENSGDTNKNSQLSTSPNSSPRDHRKIPRLPDLLHNYVHTIGGLRQVTSNLVL